jgi:hypothetical protein
MTREFGLAAMLANVRTTRIALVSREMILNFIAQYSLGAAKELLVLRQRWQHHLCHFQPSAHRHHRGSVRRALPSDGLTRI